MDRCAGVGRRVFLGERVPAVAPPQLSLLLQLTRAPPAPQGGVVDALTRRYLRRLFFGISRDPEGKDLLEEVGAGVGWGGGGQACTPSPPAGRVGPGGRQGVASQRLRRGCCTHQLGAAPSSQPRTPAPHSLPPTSLGPQYVFSFTYGEGGGVSMRLGAHGGRELSTHATDDLGRIKYETCRLMRMLVTITQSLEQARVRVSWAWQRGGWLREGVRVPPLSAERARNACALARRSPASATSS